MHRYIFSFLRVAIPAFEKCTKEGFCAKYKPLIASGEILDLPEYAQIEGAIEILQKTAIAPYDCYNNKRISGTLRKSTMQRYKKEILHSVVSLERDDSDSEKPILQYTFVEEPKILRERISSR